MADSKQFGKGQRQPHIGAPRSQSGTQNFDNSPKPRRSGPSIGEQIAGYRYDRSGSNPMGHGGSKKQQKKR